MSNDDTLKQLLNRIHACRVCEASLPFEPRPILRAGATSRVLIVGQAPGRKVHETGIPWNDAAGDRLREWLQLDRETFYDESRIAIVPVGLCYPGTGKSGDLPPRPECAPLWHPPLLEELKNIELILLIGAYARNFYLKEEKKKSLTETVRSYRDHLPLYFTLAHPSPRNKLWLKNNPWFEDEVIPQLRKRVRAVLQ
jgi:uracil-DNA glycosylase